MYDQVNRTFTSRVIGAFGEDGRRWLRRLPELIDRACERWSLKASPPYKPLSYNYVAPAIEESGQSVVLKIGVPRHELTTEVAALRHFDGHGMVRLLKADAQDGLLLLEQVRPGEQVATIGDETVAVEAFAKVVTKMAKTAPVEKIFPHLSDWVKGFTRYRQAYAGNAGPLPKDTVEKAGTIMNDLIGSSKSEILLHGDLHHFNILSSDREGWIGIDPKGVIGEIEYEASAFLRNPYPVIGKMSVKTFAMRIDELCERLHFDKKRILNWAYAQTVLSAVWSLEDNDDWQSDLACGERFAHLI